MLVLATAGVAVGCLRTLAQTSLQRTLLYVTVTQASLLLLFLIGDRDLLVVARPFHLQTLAGLTLAMAAGSCIAWLAGSDTTASVFRAGVRDPLAIIALGIGLVVAIGAPTTGAFGYRSELIRRTIFDSWPSVALSDIVVVTATLASVAVPLFAVTRRAFRPLAPHMYSIPVRLPATRLTLTLASMVVLAFSVGTSLADPTSQPGELRWPRAAADGLLLLAVLVATGLFLVESAIVGRHNSVGRTVRGAVRSLGDASLDYHRAADRGTFDVLALGYAGTLALTRGVVYVIDHTLGQLVRSSGD